MIYCITSAIKRGFSCINVRQVPREMLKTEGKSGKSGTIRELAEAVLIGQSPRFSTVYEGPGEH